MLVEHRTTIVARCPVNNGVDYYDATFQTKALVKVEDIDAAIGKLTAKPIFHEDLVKRLARATGCKVTLVGRHGRFMTTATS